MRKRKNYGKNHTKAQKKGQNKSFCAAPILKPIMPNKAVQLVQLLGSTKREKRLGTVILFVTSRCNSFCRTCFYHEELNRPGDLTFEQIEKVSQTMPPMTRQKSSGCSCGRTACAA